jgi:hypothetical protein
MLDPYHLRTLRHLFFLRQPIVECMNCKGDLFVCVPALNFILPQLLRALLVLNPKIVGQKYWMVSLID